MAGRPSSKSKKKLGKRYPVQIPCQNKAVGNQYAMVVKTVIDFFGMTIANNPTAGKREGRKATAKSSSGRNPDKKPVTGSSKGRSIKIPVDADGTKFKSMPIPSGATYEDVRTFLNGLKSNKPKFFITDGGQTLFLNAKDR